MAPIPLRILTRLSLHVDNETVTYEPDTVQTLDDELLHLVERGLAIVATDPQ